ncbi:MAG: nuclear transport factor 2 family protein [Candidatus Binatia bacterium]
MTDRAAIEALIFAYAERIDAGDLDGLATLFRAATYRSDKGGHYDGADALGAVLRARVILHADGTPRTKHVTTNLVIELEPDAATARSYYTVFQAVDDLPLQPIIAGRYHDRFVRGADGWCFADRLVFIDLVGDLSRHLRS